MKIGNSNSVELSRRLWLAQEKARRARSIPNLGLFVTKAEVKTQRYLRDHGLPHSANVASVLMPRDLICKPTYGRGPGKSGDL